MNNNALLCGADTCPPCAKVIDDFGSDALPHFRTAATVLAETRADFDPQACPEAFLDALATDDPPARALVGRQIANAFRQSSRGIL